MSISAHGAAGVLVTGDGDAAPPVDYEFDGFAAVDADYDALRPPFEECFRRVCRAGSISDGRSSFSNGTVPEEFARARAFLGYPQYWAWRLSGVAATEATALGAHTDLWRPYEGRLSSLVERAGWTRLFPPLRRAWDTLGPLRPEVAAATGLPPDVRVDLRRARFERSARPLPRFAQGPVHRRVDRHLGDHHGGRRQGRARSRADIFANVDVLGRPLPTARLMGGREFAALAGDAPRRRGPGRRGDRRLGRDGDARVLRPGRTVRRPQRLDRGRSPDSARGARRARDPLFRADDRLSAGAPRRAGRHRRRGRISTGRRPIPASSPRSCPDRTILVAPASGAAEGAAMLARWGEPHAPPSLVKAAPWDLPGLEAYAERWRARLPPPAPGRDPGSASG